VSARDAVFLVKFGEPGGRAVRFKISLETGSVVVKGTAYNLFYATVVQVYAGAKLGH
jgi:hypothetical protein